MKQTTAGHQRKLEVPWETVRLIQTNEGMVKGANAILLSLWQIISQKTNQQMFRKRKKTVRNKRKEIDGATDAMLPRFLVHDDVSDGLGEWATQGASGMFWVLNGRKERRTEEEAKRRKGVQTKKYVETREGAPT